jgi:hypothetical protein
VLPGHGGLSKEPTEGGMERGFLTVDDADDTANTTIFLRATPALTYPHPRFAFNDVMDSTVIDGEFLG